LNGEKLLTKPWLAFSPQPAGASHQEKTRRGPHRRTIWSLWRRIS